MISQFIECLLHLRNLEAFLLVPSLFSSEAILTTYFQLQLLDREHLQRRQNRTYFRRTESVSTYRKAYNKTHGSLPGPAKGPRKA